MAANPDLAEAQHALGHIKWAFEWDWPAAEAAFRRAIALDPSYSLVQCTAHLISQTVATPAETSWPAPELDPRTAVIRLIVAGGMPGGTRRSIAAAPIAAMYSTRSSG